jgi:hypothetical protein
VRASDAPDGHHPQYDLLVCWKDPLGNVWAQLKVRHHYNTSGIGKVGAEAVRGFGNRDAAGRLTEAIRSMLIGTRRRPAAPPAVIYRFDVRRDSTTPAVVEPTPSSPTISPNRFSSPLYLWRCTPRPDGDPPPPSTSTTFPHFPTLSSYQQSLHPLPILPPALQHQQHQHHQQYQKHQQPQQHQQHQHAHPSPRQSSPFHLRLHTMAHLLRPPSLPSQHTLQALQS